MRTLLPSLSPIPNATSFGDAGTAFAQLFYDGVEQFYCQATSCTQKIPDSISGASDWQCSDLHCTCRLSTDLCGGGSLDLSATINALSGTFELACGAVNDNTNTATCNFKQSVLQSLFGQNGLVLDGCTSGECVAQYVIDKANDSPTVTQTSKSLSSGVIGGLAIVGGIILLSLLLLLLGLRTQSQARKAYADNERSKVSVVWSNLSYIIPGHAKGAFLAGFRRRRAHHNIIDNDKTILDSVSGNVKPGQMMAVLGPSGQLRYLCQCYVTYLCRCW